MENELKKGDVMRYKLTKTGRTGEVYIYAISPDGFYCTVDENNRTQKLKIGAHEYASTGESFDTFDEYVASRKSANNGVSLDTLFAFADGYRPRHRNPFSEQERVWDVIMYPIKHKQIRGSITLYIFNCKNVIDTEKKYRFYPYISEDKKRLYIRQDDKGLTISTAGKYPRVRFTDMTEGFQFFKLIDEEIGKLGHELRKNWKFDPVCNLYYIDVEED